MNKPETWVLCPLESNPEGEEGAPKQLLINWYNGGGNGRMMSIRTRQIIWTWEDKTTLARKRWEPELTLEAKCVAWTSGEDELYSYAAGRINLES